MNSGISHIFRTIGYSSIFLFIRINTSIDPKYAKQWYQEATQKHGTQDAQECYQKLGREALQLLGLKAPTYFCIKKLAKSSPDYSAAACHLNGAVFVKEEHLDQQKTGMQRLTLFHEIIHLKQFMKNNGQVSVCNTRYKSVEKEADLEAARIGNCWKCTQEFSAKAENKNSTNAHAQQLHKKGYATTEEFLALAAQQKEAGACCQCHKNS